MSPQSNLIALVGLVLAANVLGLVDTARNRMGAYREMELGRFELSVQPASRNRSTVEISILEGGCQHSDDWLDDAKMQELGFAPIRSREDTHQLPRIVWAALELGGTAYERCAERSTRQHPISRLVMIDAGQDRTVLEERYPDQNRHWIVRAEASPAFLREGRRGAVSLRVPSFIVPRQYADLFREWPANSDDIRVTVRLGSQYEPWLVSAKRIDTIAR